VIALWKKAPAPMLSPCTGVCRLGVDGLCEGCHRSADEIAGWSSYSDSERRRLMDAVLPARAQRPSS
jgi:predicted Fe-S protein YdhL (DUF1289 family)